MMTGLRYPRVVAQSLRALVGRKAGNDAFPPKGGL